MIGRLDNYTMSVPMARKIGAFRTEAEYDNYDEERRSRNKSPMARCSMAECGSYNIFKACKGFCDKIDKEVSTLTACPDNNWK